MRCCRQRPMRSQNYVFRKHELRKRRGKPRCPQSSIIELIDVLWAQFCFTEHQRPGQSAARTCTGSALPAPRRPSSTCLPPSVLSGFGGAGFVGSGSGSDGGSGDGPSGGGKSGAGSNGGGKSGGGSNGGGMSGDGASGGENADGGSHTDDGPRIVECMLYDVQGLCLLNEYASSSFTRRKGPPSDGPSPPSPRPWRACRRSSPDWRARSRRAWRRGARTVSMHETLPQR
jgi:hypothetical protein